MLSKFLNPNQLHSVRVSVGFLKKTSPRPQSQKWAPLFCTQNHSHFVRTFHPGALLLNENDNSGKKKALTLDSSADEVAEWIKQTYGAKFVQDFDGLSVPSLLKLSEKALVARSKVGDVVYASLQELKNLPAKLDPQARLHKDLEKLTDDSYPHLKDITKLEKLIGKTIQLPRLGELPKELDAAKVKSFFLTQERFQVLKKVWDAVKMDKMNESNVDPQAGMIPSGPHGISKTIIAYFIASVAYANNCIVLYMETCRDWVTLGSAERAQLFLDRFLELNADKASTIGVTKSEALKFGCKNLTELAAFGSDNKEHAVRVQQLLMTELGRYYQRPVFYIFDEHQELWADGCGLKSADNPTYFKDFNTFTAATKGSRTFTIYVGSANSQFEDPVNLPKGAAEKTKVFIQPFTQEEFNKIVTDKNNAFAFVDRKDKVVSDDLDYLYEITGGAPRDMLSLQRTLKEGSPIHGWFLARIGEHYNSIEKWEKDQLAEAGKLWSSDEEKKEMVKERKRAFLDFLGHLLLPQFFGELPTKPISIPGRFYDKGLIFYNTKLFKYQAISLAALVALQKYYYKMSELPPISSRSNRSVQGSHFEEWIRNKISSGSVSSLEGFVSNKLADGTYAGAKISLLAYSTVATLYFKLGEFPLNQTRLPVVYAPLSSNHGSWDLVMHIPTTNHYIFMQMAINGYKNHDKTKDRVKSSFTKEHIVHVNKKEKGIQRCQVEQILDGISGIEGHTAEIDETNHSLVVRPPKPKDKNKSKEIGKEGEPIMKQEGHMEIDPKSPEEVPIHVDFVCFSGIDDDVPPPAYSNLVVVPKKFCQERLGVAFDY